MMMWDSKLCIAGSIHIKQMVIPLVAKTTDLGGRNAFLELAFLHYGSSLKLVAVLKKALWRLFWILHLAWVYDSEHLLFFISLT